MIRVLQNTVSYKFTFDHSARDTHPQGLVRVFIVAGSSDMRHNGVVALDL